MRTGDFNAAAAAVESDLPFCYALILQDDFADYIKA